MFRNIGGKNVKMDSQRTKGDIIVKDEHGDVVGDLHIDAQMKTNAEKLRDAKSLTVEAKGFEGMGGAGGG